jgi:serine/threonine-protein kinase
MQHSARTSNIVIGLLLLAALVVAAVLLLALRMPDPEAAEVPDTPASGGLEESAGGAEGALTPPAEVGTTDGPAAIATVTAWDPDGDNGGENDAQAVLALPDSGTEGGWPTECYSSQYLGAKRGVGLVVALTAPSGGAASVESFNAPYQLEWYASPADVPPTDLDGWGAPLDGTVYDTTPGTVEVDVPEGTTHLLVWLRELGPDDACSSTNPYRGRLGELTFRP